MSRSVFPAPPCSRVALLAVVALAGVGCTAGAAGDRSPAGATPVRSAATVASAAPTTPPVGPTPTPSTAATEPTAAPSPSASAAIPSVQPTRHPPTLASGTVAVVLTDAMRFDPSHLAARTGETITFEVRNTGVIPHELFIGTAAEQQEHAAEMAAHGASAHGHDNAIRLEGGESGTLAYTVGSPGQLLLGCHEPGHYNAGMVGLLEVLP